MAQPLRCAVQTGTGHPLEVESLHGRFQWTLQQPSFCSDDACTSCTWPLDGTMPASDSHAQRVFAVAQQTPSAEAATNEIGATLTVAAQSSGRVVVCAQLLDAPALAGAAARAWRTCTRLRAFDRLSTEPAGPLYAPPASQTRLRLLHRDQQGRNAELPLPSAQHLFLASNVRIASVAIHHGIVNALNEGKTIVAVADVALNDRPADVLAAVSVCGDVATGIEPGVLPAAAPGVAALDGVSASTACSVDDFGGLIVPFAVAAPTYLATWVDAPTAVPPVTKQLEALQGGSTSTSIEVQRALANVSIHGVDAGYAASAPPVAVTPQVQGMASAAFGDDGSGSAAVAHVRCDGYEVSSCSWSVNAPVPQLVVGAGAYALMPALYTSDRNRLLLGQNVRFQVTVALQCRDNTDVEVVRLEPVLPVGCPAATTTTAAVTLRCDRTHADEPQEAVMDQVVGVRISVSGASSNGGATNSATRPAVQYSVVNGALVVTPLLGAATLQSAQAALIVDTMILPIENPTSHATWQPPTDNPHLRVRGQLDIIWPLRLLVPATAARLPLPADAGGVSDIPLVRVPCVSGTPVESTLVTAPALAVQPAVTLTGRLMKLTNAPHHSQLLCTHQVVCYELNQLHDAAASPPLSISASEAATGVTVVAALESSLSIVSFVPTTGLSGIAVAVEAAAVGAIRLHACGRWYVGRPALVAFSAADQQGRPYHACGGLAAVLTWLVRDATTGVVTEGVRMRHNMPADVRTGNSDLRASLAALTTAADVDGICGAVEVAFGAAGDYALEVSGSGMKATARIHAVLPLSMELPLLPPQYTWPAGLGDAASRADDKPAQRLHVTCGDVVPVVISGGHAPADCAAGLSAHACVLASAPLNVGLQVPTWPGQTRTMVITAEQAASTAGVVLGPVTVTWIPDPVSVADGAPRYSFVVSAADIISPEHPASLTLTWEDVSGVALQSLDVLLSCARSRVLELALLPAASTAPSASGSTAPAASTTIALQGIAAAQADQPATPAAFLTLVMPHQDSMLHSRTVRVTALYRDADGMPLAVPVSTSPLAAASLQLPQLHDLNVPVAALGSDGALFTGTIALPADLARTKGVLVLPAAHSSVPVTLLLALAWDVPELRVSGSGTTTVNASCFGGSGVYRVHVDDPCAHVQLHPLPPSTVTPSVLGHDAIRDEQSAASMGVTATVTLQDCRADVLLTCVDTATHNRAVARIRMSSVASARLLLPPYLHTGVPAAIAMTFVDAGGLAVVVAPGESSGLDAMVMLEYTPDQHSTRDRSASSDSLEWEQDQFATAPTVQRRFIHLRNMTQLRQQRSGGRTTVTTGDLLAATVSYPAAGRLHAQLWAYRCEGGHGVSPIVAEQAAAPPVPGSHGSCTLLSTDRATASIVPPVHVYPDEVTLFQWATVSLHTSGVHALASQADGRVAEGHVTLHFSSREPEVATVSIGGTITGRRAGKTAVTVALIAAGREVAKIATVPVSVVSASAHITAVIMSQVEAPSMLEEARAPLLLQPGPETPEHLHVNLYADYEGFLNPLQSSRYSTTQWVVRVGAYCPTRRDAGAMMMAALHGGTDLSAAAPTVLDSSGGVWASCDASVPATSGRRTITCSGTYASLHARALAPDGDLQAASHVVRQTSSARAFASIFAKVDVSVGGVALPSVWACRQAVIKPAVSLVYPLPPVTTDGLVRVAPASSFQLRVSLDGRVGSAEELTAPQAVTSAESTPRVRFAVSVQPVVAGLVGITVDAVSGWMTVHRCALSRPWQVDDQEHARVSIVACNQIPLHDGHTAAACSTLIVRVVCTPIKALAVVAIDEHAPLTYAALQSAPALFQATVQERSDQRLLVVPLAHDGSPLNTHLSSLCLHQMAPCSEPGAIGLYAASSPVEQLGAELAWVESQPWMKRAGAAPVLLVLHGYAEGNAAARVLLRGAASGAVSGSAAAMHEDDALSPSHLPPTRSHVIKVSVLRPFPKLVVMPGSVIALGAVGPQPPCPSAFTDPWPPVSPHARNADWRCSNDSVCIVHPTLACAVARSVGRAQLLRWNTTAADDSGAGQWQPAGSVRVEAAFEGTVRLRSLAPGLPILGTSPLAMADRYTSLTDAPFDVAAASLPFTGAFGPAAPLQPVAFEVGLQSARGPLEDSATTQHPWTFSCEVAAAARNGSAFAPGRWYRALAFGPGAPPAEYGPVTSASRLLAAQRYVDAYVVAPHKHKRFCVLLASSWMLLQRPHGVRVPWTTFLPDAAQPHSINVTVTWHSNASIAHGGIWTRVFPFARRVHIVPAPIVHELLRRDALDAATLGQVHGVAVVAGQHVASASKSWFSQQLDTLVPHTHHSQRAAARAPSILAPVMVKSPESWIVLTPLQPGFLSLLFGPLSAEVSGDSEQAAAAAADAAGGEAMCVEGDPIAHSIGNLVIEASERLRVSVAILPPLTAAADGSGHKAAVPLLDDFECWSASMPAPELAAARRLIVQACNVGRCPSGILHIGLASPADVIAGSAAANVTSPLASGSFVDAAVSLTHAATQHTIRLRLAYDDGSGLPAASTPETDAVARATAAETEVADDALTGMASAVFKSLPVLGAIAVTAAALYYGARAVGL